MQIKIVIYLFINSNAVIFALQSYYNNKDKKIMNSAISKSEVMKEAWRLYRSNYYASFGKCLSKAWSILKQLSKESAINSGWWDNSNTTLLKGTVTIGTTNADQDIRLRGSLI